MKRWLLFVKWFIWTKFLIVVAIANVRVGCWLGKTVVETMGFGFNLYNFLAYDEQQLLNEGSVFACHSTHGSLNHLLYSIS